MHIHSRLVKCIAVYSHNGLLYSHKNGKNNNILHSIDESYKCNVKLDTEACQLYESIYMKFKNRKNESLLFKVKITIILGQNVVVATRKGRHEAFGSCILCLL